MKNALGEIFIIKDCQTRKSPNEYLYIFKWTQEKGYKNKWTDDGDISGGGPDIPPEQPVTEVQFPIK